MVASHNDNIVALIIDAWLLMGERRVRNQEKDSRGERKSKLTCLGEAAGHQSMAI